MALNKKKKVNEDTYLTDDEEAFQKRQLVSFVEIKTNVYLYCYDLTCLVLNNNVPLFWNSIKAEMFGLQRLLV
jgi:hypothetical protein